MATNTITPPPLPTDPAANLAGYITLAQNQVSQGSDQVNSAILNQASVQQQNDTVLAGDANKQMSVLQQTYADLAKEFNVEEGQEVGQAQQTGQAEIGSAQVSNAKAGIDSSAQGAFNAPVTAARADLQSTLGQIAEKYQAKQSDIADALAGNLQQVQTQIDQYTADGNTAYAAALTQVAQLKYQENQTAISLAQQMTSAQTAAEQDAWKDYKDEVTAQYQAAEIDHLSAEDSHLEAEDAKDAATAATDSVQKNNVGGFTYFSKTGAPIPAAQFAKDNGMGLINVLSNSTDQGSKDFITEFNKLQQQIANAGQVRDPKTGQVSNPGDLRSEANAYLKQNYPQIVGDIDVL